MFNIFLFNILILLSLNVFASSKIYLIRHAKVQIENPGWCSSQIASHNKDVYNSTSVQVFNPDEVLSKIDFPATIDTVFCSPQLRAIETAELLFDKNVMLKINDNLMELDYPVLEWSIIKLPVKAWLTISFIAWIAGNNKNEKLSYKKKKQNLETYSNELITYAETHGASVVIAHGMLNRELIKILKKKGWKFEHKDGFGNLSVNCLVK